MVETPILGRVDPLNRYADVAGKATWVSPSGRRNASLASDGDSTSVAMRFVASSLSPVGCLENIHSSWASVGVIRLVWSPAEGPIATKRRPRRTSMTAVRNNDSASSMTWLLLIPNSVARSFDAIQN